MKNYNNFTNVTKSSLPDLDEYINEIKSIWETHWLTNMGPKHNELKWQLKEYLDVENVELFTNGHMALELSLQCLDLKGEIITTPYTFASTTHAIVRNNCKPVFCDINNDDYTIDANKIERLVTNKTSAILPVHVYGNICDVDKIDKIAKKYNLKVIYDAAHAFGEKLNSSSVGSFGDISIFSFHATKVFNTIEGGAATFHDPKIGKRLYQLKNFGIKNENEVDGVGANAKMNEFCAAMGLCNLRHINDEIAKRKIISDAYCKELSKIDGITINKLKTNIDYNYAYYPIIIDPIIFGHDRNYIYDVLKKDNIYCRKYFYPITSSFSCFGGKFDSNKTRNALKVSKNVLTLPMYADLDMNTVAKICNTIKALKH